MKQPCKNCQCRSVGCHAGCPDYATYKQELEAAKKQNHQYNIVYFAKRKIGYGGRLCRQQ